MLEKFKGFRKLLGMILGMAGILVAGGCGVPEPALYAAAGIAGAYLTGQAVVDWRAKAPPAPPVPASAPADSEAEQ